MTQDPASLLPLHLLDQDDRLAQVGALQRLHRLVHVRRIILFTGAGTSQSIGYPGWNELLQRLEAAALECDGSFETNSQERADSPLTYADRLKRHILRTANSEKYSQCICAAFEHREIPNGSFPEKLLGLHPSAIVTTNFDLVLEGCLQRASLKKDPTDTISDPTYILENGYGKPSLINDFFNALDENQLPRQIVHLHGATNVPASIILSGEEFQRVYGAPAASGNSEVTLHTKFLWTILASRRVLFVGFSLQDPEIRQLLTQVTRDVWAFDREKHYALFPLTEENVPQAISEARRMRSEYGIMCIFFEMNGSSFERLDKIIDYLGQPYKESARAPEDTPAALGAAGGQTSWMQRVTDQMSGEE